MALAAAFFVSASPTSSKISPIYKDRVPKCARASTTYMQHASVCVCACVCVSVCAACECARVGRAHTRDLAESAGNGKVVGCAKPKVEHQEHTVQGVGPKWLPTP